MGQGWLRIAHRGASGSAPEHTRPAFARAVELGVDMIELDVQLTRDQELIVIHDLNLDRTTTGRGPVRDLDLADLQHLDAGVWFGPGFAGERVLRLEEVFDLIGGRARVNVEVKAPPTDWRSLATRLIRLLCARGLLEATIISCFDPGALAAVRAEAADACIGLLWQQPDFTDAWRWARELHATSVHPHWLLASSDMIQTARLKGLRVLVWTVNEVAAMRHLVQLGVDGIISDYPDRFAQL